MNCSSLCLCGPGQRMFGNISGHCSQGWLTVTSLTGTQGWTRQEDSSLFQTRINGLFRHDFYYQFSVLKYLNVPLSEDVSKRDVTLASSPPGSGTPFVSCSGRQLDVVKISHPHSPPVTCRAGISPGCMLADRVCVTGQTAAH